MRILALVLTVLLLPVAVSAQGVRTQFLDTERLPEAHVSISPDGDDLLVTIRLTEAVTSLAFARADVVRDDALTLVSPSLTLLDDTVTGAEPFSTVTLRLTQDLTERDSRYPAMYRVGEGLMLYTPTIYPDGETWDVSLSLSEMPEGWTRWPESALPQGYLFLGPEQMVVADGGARFVFDGNGDAEFEGEIRETVAQSLAFLTEIFGSQPADTPFIATSIIASERSFNTGDVTDNAMIGIRFMGTAPDPTAPGALASTRSLILHEGVHFWNGGVASFDPETPAWLHEGGAEYIATLASYRIGWTGREELMRTFGSWLDRCQTSLGYSEEAALNDFSFIPASLRYSCGPLLHLLVELYQAEQDGAPTVMDAWRETVAAAAAADGEYDLADWVAASGTSDLLANPALNAVLTTSGAQRWQTVNAELERLGIVISRTTSPPLRARTALMHLIRGECSDLQPGEGYGFYSGPEAYRLDTPEGCGVLTGNPVIATLNQRPVVTISETDYAQLQAMCLAGRPILFGTVDGEEIPVACTMPLPAAATVPGISALPDIAAFRGAT